MSNYELGIGVNLNVMPTMDIMTKNDNEVEAGGTVGLSVYPLAIRFERYGGI